MSPPPGSYAERTRLAWRRTVLVAGVVALLLVRITVDRGAAWLAPAAVVAWLIAAVTAELRTRTLAAAEPARVGRALTIVVLLTLGYAGMGAAATLLR
jgi:hypothetical protein